MTAMGTSKSGYIQRRIVKCLEDMQIQYDGTVRNASGFIYQCSYGYDGMDTKHTVKVKDDIEICDISRIVDRLNMEVEIEDDSNKVEEVIEEPKKKSKKDKKSEEKVEEVVEEPKKKSKKDKKSEEKVEEVVEEPKKKSKKEKVEESKEKKDEDVVKKTKNEKKSKNK